jgi:cyanophycin synthetase
VDERQSCAVIRLRGWRIASTRASNMCMVNPGLYYGYDFGSTGPCVRLSVKLAQDLVADFASVDAWLADRFRVNPEDLKAVQASPRRGANAQARATVDRALLLYGELARASNLPCFDRGCVIGIERVPGEAGMLTVLVALPAIDNLPKKLFANLFNEALHAVRDCSRIAPTAGDHGSKVIARLEKAVEQAAARSPFKGTSTIPLCQIAHRHDLPFRHLGGGMLRLGVGSESQMLHKSSLQADSAIGSRLCDDKRHTARFLHAAGLPGAEHILVKSPEAAHAAAVQLGWPVVVKPADRERSEGVTVGVSDEAALVAAYEKARRTSANVLVEREVAGTCHRILIAGGKVLYVVKRVPKRVQGNGRDSIVALVEEANARRAKMAPWKQFKPHVLDALALECLAADGFTPSSIPAAGQFAYLRPMALPEWGGAIEDLIDDIHPENAELAVVATQLFGLVVAGVDLITPDIAQPWHANGAIINEMNYRPQFAVEQRELDTSILANALAPGGGRIPVHLVVGSGDLGAAADKLKRRLAKSGQSCHSTSATVTQGPDGRAVHFAATTLFERSLLLAMRPDVRGLILIGSPDELFERGLAVDRLDTIEVVEADASAAKRLLDQLKERFVMRPAVGVSKARARSSRS